MAVLAMANILIVDDHADTLDIMRRWVLSWGHHPVTAATGESGLALLKTEKVELVIVDGMLPGMNGVEFIRLMCADPETATIPAILFTALDDHLFLENAIAKGASECWLKGKIEPDGMRERINWHLDRRN